MLSPFLCPEVSTLPISPHETPHLIPGLDPRSFLYKLEEMRRSTLPFLNLKVFLVINDLCDIRLTSFFRTRWQSASKCGTRNPDTRGTLYSLYSVWCGTRSMYLQIREREFLLIPESHVVLSNLSRSIEEGQFSCD